MTDIFIMKFRFRSLLECQVYFCLQELEIKITKFGVTFHDFKNLRFEIS